MAGQRQPIELVIAKGNKHLTKAEIEARRNGEIGPLSGDITPPAYLTKKQKAEFNTIAEGDEPKPVKLIDSQAFDIGCTFGWIKTANNKRGKSNDKNYYSLRYSLAYGYWMVNSHRCLLALGFQSMVSRFR